MSGRQLTDVEISVALRAHVPERTQLDLRERILEAAEGTAQQRPLPSFLGALSDADPIVRRRNLLIAAAFVAALAIASVAAVGAWRQLHRDPIPKLLLDRPADVQAYVFSSRERLPDLPPVALTVLNNDATTDRIYVDQSGAVRLERFASAEATKPRRTLLLSGNSTAATVMVAGNSVWLRQDEAIGDDPRLYLRAISGLTFGGDKGCEATQEDAANNGTTVTGWQYVDAELVAGRPAQHLACGASDLWLDDATRLVLRIRQPNTDDAGDPIPGSFKTTEVTKIEFGDQPAALFSFDPPNGSTAMSLETYGSLCPGDTIAFLDFAPCAGTGGTASAATPEPTPSPTPIPTPTPRPDPGDCPIPSRPSTSAGPLVWSQASVKQDWPAPVRTEPGGAPTAMPMPPTYIDPEGDTGTDPYRCIDIRYVTADEKGVGLSLVARPPSGVDPSKAWIAYGVVVDEDRDGVPDWRYGADNIPDTPGEQSHLHRAWRTNLHTGQTEWETGRVDVIGRDDGDRAVGGTFLDTSYPAAVKPTGPYFQFAGSSDTTQGEKHYGVPFTKPYYVWASVIVDGRVVATDYAPDTGWLVVKPGSMTGGTFVTGVDGLPLRITTNIPDGWSNDGPGIGDGRNDDNSLVFMSIDDIQQVACDPSGAKSTLHLGPSVNDLVSFLEGMTNKSISDKTGVRLRISETRDVTVDGYHGTYLEFRALANVDNCNPPWPLQSYEDSYHQAWILDVDGARLVIDGYAGFHPIPPANKAAFQQIVDSIEIGP